MSLLFRVGESLLIYVDALTACISDAWVQEIVFKGYIVVFHSMPSPVSSSLPVSRHVLENLYRALLGVFWVKVALSKFLLQNGSRDFNPICSSLQDPKRAFAPFWISKHSMSSFLFINSTCNLPNLLSPPLTMETFWLL